MEPEIRKRRRSVRRAVALDCALQSERWQDVVLLPASNLSTDGIWLEAPLALAPGDELIVSFTPPGARKSIWASARVVRCDERTPGMALAFTYCSDAHRRLLARALLGRPPRLPGARRPPPLPGRHACASLYARCDAADHVEKIDALPTPHADEAGYACTRDDGQCDRSCPRGSVPLAA